MRSIHSVGTRLIPPLKLNYMCSKQVLKSGNYKLEAFCMEPTSFHVKEVSSLKGGAPEFVKTKLLTRMAYNLEDVSGELLRGGRAAPSS